MTRQYMLVLPLIIAGLALSSPIGLPDPGSSLSVVRAAEVIEDDSGVIVDADGTEEEEEDLIIEEEEEDEDEDLYDYDEEYEDDYEEE